MFCCSSCVFLGCGERNVHDTKRAETLSRNRNEVWSLQSALPEKREEGREESREKHTEVRMRRDCIAELDDWMDSSRERIHTRSPVPDVSRNAAEFPRNSSVLSDWYSNDVFSIIFFSIMHFTKFHDESFNKLIIRWDIYNISQRKLSDVQIEYSIAVEYYISFISGTGDKSRMSIIRNDKSDNFS